MENITEIRKKIIIALWWDAFVGNYSLHRSTFKDNRSAMRPTVRDLITFIRTGQNDSKSVNSAIFPKFWLTLDCQGESVELEPPNP